MSVYVEEARNDQMSDREPEAAIAKAQSGSGGPAKMARCLVVIDIEHANADTFAPPARVLDSNESQPSCDDS
jgi:hypothetical protein